mmetsp:Transcript_25576/g.40655  ORF Transcript_25576/g.40655 Transcript_25576/m.40655 type:complete len:228 (+) Transcript_25576:100-783(+)
MHKLQKCARLSSLPKEWNHLRWHCLYIVLMPLTKQFTQTSLLITNLDIGISGNQQIHQVSPPMMQPCIRSAQIDHHAQHSRMTHISIRSVGHDFVSAIHDNRVCVPFAHQILAPHSQHPSTDDSGNAANLETSQRLFVLRFLDILLQQKAPRSIAQSHPTEPAKEILVLCETTRFLQFNCGGIRRWVLMQIGVIDIDGKSNAKPDHSLLFENVEYLMVGSAIRDIRH